MIQTKHGPCEVVRLNHPTLLPVYRKVANYRRHPAEGPPITLVSGGNGARAVSETLISYTHNSYHVLPMFDDGGSSRELRQKLGMPPPGDLRNRLTSLADPTHRGNPEVRALFRFRLPADGRPEELEAELQSLIDATHPRSASIEPRYRRLILSHLERFFTQRPADFDLQLGSIGNFVIAGAYLSLGDLAAVIFEFAALAAVRGEVVPVCLDGNYHLAATLVDGSELVGQSQITLQPHPKIRRLAIVTLSSGGATEVQPELNPMVLQALRKSALVCYAMGSFYTSIVAALLVPGFARGIRECMRPKVFVANLAQDPETVDMSVSEMLAELHRYLQRCDSSPGLLTDYVNYALVSTHGESRAGGRVPVDLQQIRALGVEPIVLPLELAQGENPPRHDPERVVAALLSLC